MGQAAAARYTNERTGRANGECILLRRCYSPCGVRDDPGGGGARQARVGGHGEPEHAVQLDLQTEERKQRISKLPRKVVVTRD